MNKITLRTLNKMKAEQEKFAMLTCYDASFARVTGEAGVHCILVGDSLGMTVQGHSTTVPVTVDDVAYHTSVVARGTQYSMIVADLPFMSYCDTPTAINNSITLMQAGAHMVKLEGGQWLCDTVKALSQSGTPVCAHLGLTPQSVNTLGGYAVQGREESAAKMMLDDALALEAAGAAMLVLECVPAKLAGDITQALSIPVIGIGAGKETDAQVLVLHDLIGLTEKPPKFSKNFLAETHSIDGAIKKYVDDVKNQSFPEDCHTFN